MPWFRKKPKSLGEPPPAGVPLPPHKITSQFSEKNISFLEPSLSKTQLLVQMIDHLDIDDAVLALNRVTAREEMGATLVMPGVSLPHARLAGLERIMAAIGICPSGFPDPAAEGPVFAYFLFVSPKENTALHLRYLAGVSAIFQTEGLLEELRAMTTSQAIYERLKKAEELLP